MILESSVEELNYTYNIFLSSMRGVNFVFKNLHCALILPYLCQNWNIGCIAGDGTVE